MSQIDDIMQKIIAFRDARSWKQFHTPKDLALSLLLEAAEVAEHFQWKNDAEIAEHQSFCEYFAQKKYTPLKILPERLYPN